MPDDWEPVTPAGGAPNPLLAPGLDPGGLSFPGAPPKSAPARVAGASAPDVAAISDWERGNLLGDKAHSAIFDNSKIKRFVPNFSATIPFHVGARRTLAWFEADPARQVVKPETNAQMDGYIAAWRKATKGILA